MKTIFKLSTLILFIVGFMVSCTKDDMPSQEGDGNIVSEDGISAGDLETYQGDIGIIINTRDLVKKGYNPRKVKITTTAIHGNYDQDLNVDPYTSLAQLSLSTDELSASAEAELRNGVGLNIEVLNESNSVIVERSFSILSFIENGNRIDIDASDMEYLNQELSFNANTRYFLQLVDGNGNYGNSVVLKPASAQTNGVRLTASSSSFNAGTTTEQYMFYKYPNEPNVFAIYSASTNRYLRIGLSTRTFRQSGDYFYPTTSPNSLGGNLTFTIKREPNGLFTIRGNADGKPLRRGNDHGGVHWHTNDNGSIQYFRIIALDLDWETQVLNTQHQTPIFPPANTSFGFNSTLKNCGTGELQQQVGIEREVTTTYTTSFTETIGLSSRVTTSVDVSVSATTEANFFGSGGSVTGEVSTGLEVSVEASRSASAGSEQSTSEKNTFFSTRTVTVPPGKASLVYDAYQTYSNVRVPYVQRIRLKARDTRVSEYLSGQDIVTQLHMSSFTGTITNIGSDFVEVTVRGSLIFDNIVDTQTEVRDVPANCN